MKKILAGISLLLCPLWIGQAWGIKAVIISLEAPLFQKKSFHSTIVQYKRKGDVIVLHEKDFGPAPHEGDYQNQEFYEKEEDLLPLMMATKLRNNSSSSLPPKINWFTTLDRNGQMAYVHKKHIRFIMGDSREQTHNLPLGAYDPTDYRLEEPLPHNYPFYYHERIRGFFGIIGGPAPKVNYPYPQGIVGQNFGNHFGLVGAYTYHLSGDRHNRFYGGFYWLLVAGQQHLTLAQETTAQEVSLQLAGGPYFSYDFFRRPNWRLTIYGSILYRYHQQTVTQSNPLQEDQRSFSALVLAPMAGTMLVTKSPFPQSEFYLSSTLDILPPHSLRASSPITVPGMWTANPTEDHIRYGLSGKISLSLGLVASY